MTQASAKLGEVCLAYVVVEKEKNRFLLIEANGGLVIPTISLSSLSASAIANAAVEEIGSNAVCTGLLSLLTVSSFSRQRFAVYAVIEVPRQRDACVAYDQCEIGEWRWLSIDDVHRRAEKDGIEADDFQLIENVHRYLDPTSAGVVLAPLSILRESQLNVKPSFVGLSSTQPNRNIFAAASYSEQDLELLYDVFCEYAWPHSYLWQQPFKHLLTDVGFNDYQKSNQYFRAFDSKCCGRIHYAEFAFFCALMEPRITHGQDAGLHRSRAIFRFFASDPKEGLRLQEFGEVLSEIESKKTNICIKMEPATVEEQFNKFARKLENRFAVLMETFVNAVGSLKIRGTSILFRSTVQPSLISGFRALSVKLKEGKSFAVKEANIVMQDEARSFGSQSSSITDDDTASKEALKKPLVQSQVTVSASGAATIVQEGKRRVSQGADGSKLEQDDIDDDDCCIVYPEKQTANIMLQALSYFAKPSLGPPNTASASAKSAFSWGKFKAVELANAILDLCQHTEKLLCQEPKLVYTQSPCYVLGGIHGNLNDLLYFVDKIWPFGPDYSPAKLVFLGNYIEIGSNSVEVLCYLFSIKILFPDKVTLLRGANETGFRGHEDSQFCQQCIEMVGEAKGEELWFAFTQCFDCLPISAIIDNKIFCSCGGIPRPYRFSLQQIFERFNNDKLPNPAKIPTVWSLLAAEPVLEIHYMKKLLCEDHVLNSLNESKMEELQTDKFVSLLAVSTLPKDCPKELLSFPACAFINRQHLKFLTFR